MLNKNVMGRSAVEDPSYEDDLTNTPEYDFPPDPVDNSTAMLGPAPEGTGEVSPEEAGPGVSYSYLSMMIHGAEGLSTQIPGFVPAEITAWLQSAMQILPLLIQKMQSNIAAPMPGAGMMMPGPQMGALGPMSGQGATAEPAGVSRPPSRGAAY